jgi:hypothetical protein
MGINTTVRLVFFCIKNACEFGPPLTVGLLTQTSKSFSHSDLKTEIIVARAEISGRTLFVFGHK